MKVNIQSLTPPSFQHYSCTLMSDALMRLCIFSRLCHPYVIYFWEHHPYIFFTFLIFIVISFLFLLFSTYGGRISISFLLRCHRLTPVKCGERLNGQSQPTQVARTIDRPSIQIISVVAMVDVDPAKYERIRGMWLSIFGKEFNSATMRGSGDLLRSLEMSGGRSTQVRYLVRA